jgi:protein kinase A
VFTYLRRAKRFDEETSRFYAAEIVLILAYLHDEHGIAYRDLKPENILIDAEGHLKLVDFGFAKKIGHSRLRFPADSPMTADGDLEETYTLCGTPEYLAPEVIRNSGMDHHSSCLAWVGLNIICRARHGG